MWAKKYFNSNISPRWTFGLFVDQGFMFRSLGFVLSDLNIWQEQFKKWKCSIRISSTWQKFHYSHTHFHICGQSSASKNLALSCPISIFDWINSKVKIQYRNGFNLPNPAQLHLEFSRSSSDSSESDCWWDDVQHWDSRGALSWLDFPIDLGTALKNWESMQWFLPISLARSCALVADSEVSKSGSLTSNEVILRGGFEFNLKMFKTFYLSYVTAWVV